jgi:hypothetical protein
MQSDARRTIVRSAVVLFVLAVLAGCGGDPPPAVAATWDVGIWGTSRWQP